jgi:urease beta subunit
LAAFDLVTGTATSWDPNAGNSVNALAINGSTIYAGGVFSTINNTITRNRIAALDIATGTASAWDPNINNTVNTLAVSGSNIYAGGVFTTANGSTTRNRLAAIDATSGTVTAWDPNANSTVSSIVITGNNTYVGGAFTTIGDIVRNRFAAFSNTALPLKLLNFTAQLELMPLKKVNCNWLAAEEINFDRFAVERSANGKDYLAIGSVVAAGNSSTRHQYNFVDDSPLTGVSYYRLKQFDKDGSFTYSQVVIITTTGGSAAVLLYPNPANNVASLSVFLTQKEKLQCTMFDLGGRTMFTTSVSLNAGSNTIDIPVSQLANGTYIITLKGTDTQKQLQLIKQ